MGNTDFAEDLKHSGLKNTKSRAAVLGILENSDQPITADDLFRQISKKDIPVSLSTIYRTLETLACKNLVSKLDIIGEDKAYFEYNRLAHRHYLVCLGCKKIRSIESCPLQRYEEALKKETEYTIDGHRLNIYGYCPACQKNRQ